MQELAVVAKSAWLSFQNRRADLVWNFAVLFAGENSTRGPGLTTILLGKISPRSCEGSNFPVSWIRVVNAAYIGGVFAPAFVSITTPFILDVEVAVLLRIATACSQQKSRGARVAVEKFADALCSIALLLHYILVNHFQSPERINVSLIGWL